MTSLTVRTEPTPHDRSSQRLIACVFRRSTADFVTAGPCVSHRTDMRAVYVARSPGMSKTFAESSPRLAARLAGTFQFLEGLAATFPQMFVLDKLVIPGNAASTAANILSHEPLFLLGFASALCGVIFHIVWAFLIYELLKPVNRSLSSLALFVILVDCAIQGITGLIYLAPLVILQSGDSLSAFTAEQVQALAYLFVRLNNYGFDLYLVFFGVWCALAGYLIFRSTFIPRVFGLLLMIDGFGWLMYLSPWFAISIFPFIATASALGEIPLEFWLIIKGVNAPRWQAQALEGNS